MKKAAKRIMIGGVFVMWLGMVVCLWATTSFSSHKFEALRKSGVSHSEAVADAGRKAMVITTVGGSVGALGLVSLIAGFVVFLVSRSNTPPAEQEDFEDFK